MSYHDALNYLAQKTSVIELCDQWGGRVAVCPEWNGRILTSTYDGLEGDSFGYVNIQAIDTNSCEDFGGEDQWTISPLIHSFAVESIKENKAVLHRILQMTDANGMPAELNLSRTISMLNRRNIRNLFDDTIADSLEQDNVSVVGFCTENTVQSQEKAWIACRMRGMFNASPNMVIIVAIPPQDCFEQEPSSETFPGDIDYLGGAPHGRIRHLLHTLLIRADGHGRCQTTIPFSAAPPVFGAVDIRFGTLTLWIFDSPNDSEEDVVRIYNSGQTHPNELDWATYYEMNCFAAAKKLQPDHSFSYNQCTLHLGTDNHTLNHLIQHIFNVSLEDVSRKMLR